MNRLENGSAVHNISPVFDADSRILILGSFPSVKSRESRFFYGHPQNRFWRVLAFCLGCGVPSTVEEKKKLLLDGHVAVWDVLASCEITGSSDSSIKNAVPNDIGVILGAADIRTIFVNGRTAEKYYRKFLEPVTGVPAVCLPSTSPANAGAGFEKLCAEWSMQIRPALGTGK